MAEMLSLELVDKRMVTDQVVLTIGYDRENLSDPETRAAYKGEVTSDRYGRMVPKHAHGTENLGRQTSSAKLIVDAAMRLYGRIINEKLLVRRITIGAGRVVDEDSVKEEAVFEQLDLFTDYAALQNEREAQKEKLRKERRLQEAVLDIKKRHGKNAILKGTNLLEGATAMDRNRQIGGHKA